MTEPKLSLWEKLKVFVVVELIAFLHLLIRSTWRYKRGDYPKGIQERLDQGLPVIFGHLHQDDVSLVSFFIGVPVGVLVSRSKDGTLLAKFFKKIGFVVARGSSSRGAASGFLELLRLTQTQKLTWITFAVDGPKGPVGESKKGIFKLAEILQAPVVPVVALAPNRWTFSKSWSKTFMAKPWSVLEAKFLEPIPYEETQKYAQKKDFSKLAKIFDERILAAKGPEYLK